MSKSPVKEMLSCDLNCSEKRATLKDVVMEHFCCTLFEFYGPLKTLPFECCREWIKSLVAISSKTDEISCEYCMYMTNSVLYIFCFDTMALIIRKGELPNEGSLRHNGDKQDW